MHISFQLLPTHCRNTRGFWFYFWGYNIRFLVWSLQLQGLLFLVCQRLKPQNLLQLVMWRKKVSKLTVIIETLVTAGGNKMAITVDGAIELCSDLAQLYIVMWLYTSSRSTMYVFRCYMRVAVCMQDCRSVPVCGLCTRLRVWKMWLDNLPDR